MSHPPRSELDAVQVVAAALDAGREAVASGTASQEVVAAYRVLLEDFERVYPGTDLGHKGDGFEYLLRQSPDLSRDEPLQFMARTLLRMVMMKHPEALRSVGVALEDVKGRDLDVSDVHNFDDAVVIRRSELRDVRIDGIGGVGTGDDGEVGRATGGNVTIERSTTGDVTVVYGNLIVVQGTRSLDPPGPARDGEGLRNPYKGLAAFQEADKDDFFGREALVETLLARFRGLHRAAPGEPKPRVLTVQGPSGSGKSSVVRAGLIPALALESGGGVTRVAVLTPGEHPMDSLEAALSRLDGAEADAGGPRIVLVDQFEELYTLCTDREERGRFITRLLADAAAPGTSVILTVRSDFLDETSRSEPLRRAVAACNELVLRMNDDELRRAIAAPARRAGRPLDDAVVELLVEQSRELDGALPLLQFALTRIWEGMDRGVAPADTLRHIGGVGGALASVAEALHAGLADDADRAIARHAFLRMVQVSRDEPAPVTRRRVALNYLIGGAARERVRAVLERFAGRDERVLTFSTAAAGAQVVEITHEALIEHWTRLRGWIAEDRQVLLFQDRLCAAAHHWDERGRHENLLWRPPDLDELRDFHADRAAQISPLETEFFEKAERHWTESRVTTPIPVKPASWLRQIAAISGVLSVVFLVGEGAGVRLGDVITRVFGEQDVGTPDTPRVSPPNAAVRTVSAPSDSVADRRVRTRMPEGGSRRGRAAFECAAGGLDSSMQDEGAGKYQAPLGEAYINDDAPPGAWSAVFVSWCFSTTSAEPPFRYGATTVRILDELRRKSRTYRPTPERRPRSGDLVFAWHGGSRDSLLLHVGIIHSASGDTVYAIAVNEDYVVAGRAFLVTDPDLVEFAHIPDTVIRIDSIPSLPVNGGTPSPPPPPLPANELPPLVKETTFPVGRGQTMVNLQVEIGEPHGGTSFMVVEHRGGGRQTLPLRTGSSMAIENAAGLAGSTATVTTTVSDQDNDGNEASLAYFIHTERGTETYTQKGQLPAGRTREFIWRIQFVGLRR